MRKMIRALPWLTYLQVLLATWLLCLCLALWTTLSYVFVERVAGVPMSTTSHVVVGAVGMAVASVAFVLLWARAMSVCGEQPEEDYNE